VEEEKRDTNRIRDYHEKAKNIIADLAKKTHTK